MLAGLPGRQNHGGRLNVETPNLGKGTTHPPCIPECRYALRGESFESPRKPEHFPKHSEPKPPNMMLFGLGNLFYGTQIFAVTN